MKLYLVLLLGSVAFSDSAKPLTASCDYKNHNWSLMYDVLHDLKQMKGVPKEIKKIVNGVLKRDVKYSIGDFEAQFGEQAKVCMPKTVKFQALDNASEASEASYQCEAIFSANGHVTSVRCPGVAG